MVGYHIDILWHHPRGQHLAKRGFAVEKILLRMFMSSFDSIHLDTLPVCILSTIVSYLSCSDFAHSIQLSRSMLSAWLLPSNVKLYELPSFSKPVHTSMIPGFVEWYTRQYKHSSVRPPLCGRCSTTTDSEIVLLASVPFNGLVIFGSALTDIGYSILGGMQTLRSLEILDLITGITDSDLCDISLLADLELLALQFPRAHALTDQSCAIVLSPLRHLRSLKLFDSGLLRGSALFTGLKFPQLSKLSLRFCDKFDDEGLLAMAAVVTGLTSLDISGCSSIHDDGLAVIGTLPLTDLTMENMTQITDVGFAHLSQLRLTRLDASRVPISDDALSVLVPMPLIWLSLMMCRKITDLGLLHLVNLPLEYLKVGGHGTLVPRASMRVLSHCPLKFLQLANGQEFTGATLAALLNIAIV